MQTFPSNHTFSFPLCNAVISYRDDGFTTEVCSRTPCTFSSESKQRIKHVHMIEYIWTECCEKHHFVHIWKKTQSVTLYMGMGAFFLFALYFLVWRKFLGNFGSQVHTYCMQKQNKISKIHTHTHSYFRHCTVLYIRYNTSTKCQ